jgi:hypothetical protein
MTSITTSTAAKNDINTYFSVGRLLFLIVNFSPLEFEPLQQAEVSEDQIKLLKEKMYRWVRDDGSSFLDKATTFTVTFLNSSFNVASVNSTIC